MAEFSGDESRALRPPSGLNCMEVWGGQREAGHLFRRPGLDLWVWSRCLRDETAGGGELHFVSSCASGRITRMMLADLGGVGSQFHALASRLCELMKRNVNTIEQTRAVRQMGGVLELASALGGFASTLVSTYFASTRTFTLCNTGHPPPFLYRAADGAWSILTKSSVQRVPADPDSGLVAPEEYQQFQTRFGTGDMVLSYSPAFAECRTASGRTLGLHGLLGLVRELDVSTPSQLPGQLVARLRRDRAENLAGADATLLLSRATETPVGLRDNLFAPFRLLRPVSDRTSF